MTTRSATPRVRGSAAQPETAADRRGRQRVRPPAVPRSASEACRATRRPAAAAAQRALPAGLAAATPSALRRRPRRLTLARVPPRRRRRCRG
eukprot:79426-Chlamydomonas_euryale.AAC.7